jgi:hypothetical protein
MADRTKQSVDIFNEYGDFQTVHEWEKPILKSTPCIDAMCKQLNITTRAWPTELKTIKPLGKLTRRFRSPYVYLDL